MAGSQITDRVDIYDTFIRDHEGDIVENLNINQIMRHFPHKEAISADDFTKISNAKNNATKSKLFIHRILRRKRGCELEAFVDLVTKYKDKDYLLVYLRRRLAEGITADHMHEHSGTYRSDLISSSENDSIKKSELPTKEVTKTSLAKDKTIHDLRDKLNAAKVRLEEAKQEIASRNTEDLARMEAGREKLESEVRMLQREVLALRQNDQTGKITGLEKDVTDLKEQIECLKKQRSFCCIT